MKTLVIGYGNVTRSDDGAGIRIAEQIALKNLAGVEVRTLQQLHVELVEDFVGQDLIILADASSGSSEISIKPVRLGEEACMASTHHLGAGVLAGLAAKLYSKNLNLYLCAVRGENFDFGMTLSPATARRVDAAVKEITKLIERSLSHA